LPVWGTDEILNDFLYGMTRGKNQINDSENSKFGAVEIPNCKILNDFPNDLTLDKTIKKMT
jgi:hypothetical protein